VPETKRRRQTAQLGRYILGEVHVRICLQDRIYRYRIRFRRPSVGTGYFLGRSFFTLTCAGIDGRREGCCDSRRNGRSLKGEELKEYAYPSEMNLDKALELSGSVPGVIAILPGVSGFAKKEPARVAGGAAVFEQEL